MKQSIFEIVSNEALTDSVYKMVLAGAHVLVGIPCYDFTPITCPTFCDPLLKG